MLFDEDKYNEDQLEELLLAKRDGINPEKIANPKLTDKQMYELRMALVEGYDISHYNDPRIPAHRMNVYRYAQSIGVNVSLILTRRFTHEELEILIKTIHYQRVKYGEIDDDW